MKRVIATLCLFVLLTLVASNARAWIFEDNVSLHADQAERETAATRLLAKKVILIASWIEVASVLAVLIFIVIKRNRPGKELVKPLAVLTVIVILTVIIKFCFCFCAFSYLHPIN